MTVKSRSRDTTKAWDFDLHASIFGANECSQPLAHFFRKFRSNIQSRGTARGRLLRRFVFLLDFLLGKLVTASYRLPRCLRICGLGFYCCDVLLTVKFHEYFVFRIGRQPEDSETSWWPIWRWRREQGNGATVVFQYLYWCSQHEEAMRGIFTGGTTADGTKFCWVDVRCWGVAARLSWIYIDECLCAYDPPCALFIYLYRSIGLEMKSVVTVCVGGRPPWSCTLSKRIQGRVAQLRRIIIHRLRPFKETTNQNQSNHWLDHRFHSSFGNQRHQREREWGLSVVTL